MSWQKDGAPTVLASEVNYTLQSIQPLRLHSGIILVAKSYFPFTGKGKKKKKKNSPSVSAELSYKPL